MMTKETKDRIVNLNLNGLTVREIATATGETEVNIRNLLRREGFEINRVRFPKRPDPRPRPIKTAGNDRAFRELALAIIEKASYDYRRYMRGTLQAKYIGRDCEKFFQSDYYELLISAAETKVSGEHVIKTIREQEEKRRLRIYEKNRARADREAQELASAAASIQDDKGSDT